MDKGSSSKRIPVKQLDIPLNRDLFLRSLIRELSGTLEDLIGIEDASGFVSIVGQTIGGHINSEYKKALSIPKLSRSELADVLENLKSRIQGDFYIIEQDDNRIIFGNRECPFGDYVKDRTSMCMMTSNVFGTIASENVGYAKVVIEEAIAQHHSECRVVVYLTQTGESQSQVGHEYFGVDD
ncbi:methanogen output domain 1-containing protein [Marinobacter goseongensis]|uniref:methanogen output domain 1-containing protein n=1 Tax=Marinobacter goseongensis TaxID=453838 RepID=UPI0020034EC3|nr:methanogen output domain 1-containing protein [Marinobacter goseongensis]MCK7550579.1 methanogen output domain 1-containing protein [Marinobacter goseongensis]